MKRSSDESENYCKSKKTKNNDFIDKNNCEPVEASEDPVKPTCHYIDEYSCNNTIGLSQLLQVDGTADEGNNKSHETEHKNNSSQKVDMVNHSVFQGGAANMLVGNNHLTVFETARSAASACGSSSMCPEQGLSAYNAGKLRPSAVLSQQSYNGVNTAKAPNYPSFMMQQQVQRQQHVRLQPYQIVTGLPFNWNAADMQKVLPADFDPRLRMQQFALMDYQNAAIASQNSLANSQFSSSPAVLGVRLHHPVTCYSSMSLPSNSITVAPTISGSMVRIPSSNVLSLAPHNQISQTKAPTGDSSGVSRMKMPIDTGARHGTPCDAGKNSIVLQHGARSNFSGNSAVQDSGQWVAYQHGKHSMESQYHSLNYQRQRPQMLNDVKPKAEIAMPYSVNNLLNAPARCISGVSASMPLRMSGNEPSLHPAALAANNQFWMQSSGAMINKQLRGAENVEQAMLVQKPYYRTDAMPSQAMPSGVSNYQKLLNFMPNTQLCRPEQSRSDNVAVAPCAQNSVSSLKSEANSFAACGINQMRLPGAHADVNKPSNYFHTGAQIKQFPMVPRDDYIQQSPVCC